MLSYVAAVATAVTLMITPVVSSTKEASRKKQSATWTQYAEKQPIEIQGKIELSGPRPLYVLSSAEQGAFRRALLRSVRVISGGKAAA